MNSNKHVDGDGPGPRPAKTERLRRRYLNLGIGELAATAAFIVAAVYFVTPRLPRDQDRMAFWAALIPLLVILVAAGLYWLLARTWVGRTVMPRSLARTYKALRAVCLVLLVGGLVGVACGGRPAPASASS